MNLIFFSKKIVSKLDATVFVLLKLSVYCIFSVNCIVAVNTVAFYSRVASQTQLSTKLFCQLQEEQFMEMVNCNLIWRVSLLSTLLYKQTRIISNVTLRKQCVFIYRTNKVKSTVRYVHMPTVILNFIYCREIENSRVNRTLVYNKYTLIKLSSILEFEFLMLRIGNDLLKHSSTRYQLLCYFYPQFLVYKPKALQVYCEFCLVRGRQL